MPSSLLVLVDQEILMGRRPNGDAALDIDSEFPLVEPLELSASEREMLFDKHAQFCQNVRSNAEVNVSSQSLPP